MDCLESLRSKLENVKADYNAIKYCPNITHKKEKDRLKAIRDEVQEELNKALALVAQASPVVQATPVPAAITDTPAIHLPATQAHAPPVTAVQTATQPPAIHVSTIQAHAPQVSSVQATAHSPAVHASSPQAHTPQVTLFQATTYFSSVHASTPQVHTPQATSVHATTSQAPLFTAQTPTVQASAGQVTAFHGPMASAAMPNIVPEILTNVDSTNDNSSRSYIQASNYTSAQPANIDINAPVAVYGIPTGLEMGNNVSRHDMSSRESTADGLSPITNSLGVMNSQGSVDAYNSLEDNARAEDSASKRQDGDTSKLREHDADWSPGANLHHPLHGAFQNEDYGYKIGTPIHILTAGQNPENSLDPEIPLSGRSMPNSEESGFHMRENRMMFTSNDQYLNALSVASTSSLLGQESFGPQQTPASRPPSTLPEHIERTQGPNMSSIYSPITPVNLTHGLPLQCIVTGATGDKLGPYRDTPSITPMAPVTPAEDWFTYLPDTSDDSAGILGDSDTPAPSFVPNAPVTFSEHATHKSVALDSRTAWNARLSMEVFEEPFSHPMNVDRLQSIHAAEPEHPYDTSGPSNSEDYSDFRALQSVENCTNAGSHSLAIPASPLIPCDEQSFPLTHSQPDFHAQTVNYMSNTPTGGSEKLPDTPKVKEAQRRLDELKQVISELERCLQEKQNEMKACAAQYERQDCDIETFFDRGGAIHNSIKRIRADIEDHSFDLRRAEETFFQVVQHEQDLALWSKLKTELSDIVSKLLAVQILPYAVYMELVLRRQALEGQLVEVEGKLRQPSPELEDGDEVADGASNSKLRIVREDKDSGSEKRTTPADKGNKPKKRKVSKEEASSEDTDVKSEEEHVPKKKLKSSRKVRRLKEPKADEDDEGDNPNCESEGRMTGGRLRQLAGKVVAKEKNLNKSRKKNDTANDGDAEADEDAPIEYAQLDELPILGLTADEYEEINQEGRAELFDFVKTGDMKTLKESIRGLARKYQAFLPQSSYLSRELAFAMHCTGQNNYQCRFHQKNRSKREHDGAGRNKVEGVGFKPDLQSEKRQEGHMNCGCPIDDVLLEYFFWKVWTARPTHPSLAMLEEGMKDLIIPPRLRAFICQNFLQYSRLTLDDIYKWQSSGMPFKTYIAQVQVYEAVEALQKAGIDINLYVESEQSDEQGLEGAQGREGGQLRGDGQGQD